MKNNENDPMEGKPPAFTRAPRCGARTRGGTPCQNPRVCDGKGGYRPRCRMHGCGKGSGGQPGNQNARKHGRYTKAAKDEMKRIMAEVNFYKDLLRALEKKA